MGCQGSDHHDDDDDDDDGTGTMCVTCRTVATPRPSWANSSRALTSRGRDGGVPWTRVQSSERPGRRMPIAEHGAPASTKCRLGPRRARGPVPGSGTGREEGEGGTTDNRAEVKQWARRIGHPETVGSPSCRLVVM